MKKPRDYVDLTIPLLPEMELAPSIQSLFLNMAGRFPVLSGVETRQIQSPST